MQRTLFLVHREAEDAFGTLLFTYLRMNEISSETLVVKKYVWAATEYLFVFFYLQM
jgi:hypothetical protein